LIECASTRARSDPKERRDAGFFAVIGFPHAEYIANRATRLEVALCSGRCSKASGTETLLNYLVPSRTYEEVVGRVTA
jgi:hypothetical protein